FGSDSNLLTEWSHFRSGRGNSAISSFKSIRPQLLTHIRRTAHRESGSEPALRHGRSLTDRTRDRHLPWLRSRKALDLLLIQPCHRQVRHVEGSADHVEGSATR